MNLLRNAELQRNLWLEMTPQRLIVAPAVIALIAFVIVVAIDDPRNALRLFGSYGFIGATVLWGARLAAQSLDEEFAAGTWDGQRSSSLSAWDLCVGKILGGAAFAWYIGGLFLMVFFAGSATLLSLTALIKAIAGLILLAIFAQALSLLSALIAWRRLRRVADSRRRWLSLILLIFAFQGSSLVNAWLNADAAESRWLIWFGRPWPSADFLLASLALFTGWALLGLHRGMRAELQFRDPPWTWIAFVLFLQVYVAGWIGSAWVERMQTQTDAVAAVGSVAALRLVAATLVALLLAYVFVFAEAKDRLRYERLLAEWQAGPTIRLADSLPLWLVNGLISVAGSVLLIVVAIVDTDAKAGGLFTLVTGLLALLLFTIRDFAVVLWCNFGPSRRRADGAAAFYLIVLYALPIALLAAAGLSALSGLVQPFSSFSNPFWLIAALAWAAASIDLLRRRWRAGRIPD